MDQEFFLKEESWFLPWLAGICREDPDFAKHLATVRRNSIGLVRPQSFALPEAPSPAVPQSPGVQPCPSPKPKLWSTLQSSPKPEPSLRVGGLFLGREVHTPTSTGSVVVESASHHLGSSPYLPSAPWVQQPDAFSGTRLAIRQGYPGTNHLLPR